MQPLSGNHRPDLLTALMKMSLVQRLPRKMHLCRSSSNVPRLPSLLEMLQNQLTFEKVHNFLRLPRRFDFEMCFAPQRRALFRHLNFQKWSEREVLLAFSLGNVVRATTACNFSSLIWPAGSAPAALASLLFDPPEPQIIGKHSVSRLSYLFAHLRLLSSDSFSSLIFSLLLFSLLLFSSL